MKKTLNNVKLILKNCILFHNYLLIQLFSRLKRYNTTYGSQIAMKVRPRESKLFIFNEIILHFTFRLVLSIKYKLLWRIKELIERCENLNQSCSFIYYSIYSDPGKTSAFSQNYIFSHLFSWYKFHIFYKNITYI